MVNNPIVRIEHLSHRYSTAWAIRDISFEIDRTGIVGLLGSNGAGKSTTMNILSGVLNQTEGRVIVGGIDMRKAPEEAKKLIGFLPQTPPLYMDFTVQEYLNHCAHLRQMPKGTIRKAIDVVMERCGITHFRERLIRNLSGGYRQRVGIAQAIIHQPGLVVLDEPTNGLDPNQIVGVRSLIREIAEERSVIFSSHVLSEVQLLCRDIIMIDSGRIVFSDSMDAFTNYVAPHSAVLQLGHQPPDSEFLSVPGVTRVDALAPGQVRLFFEGSPEITGQIVETGVNRGWKIREITLDKSSLDEIFAQLSNKTSK